MRRVVLPVHRWLGLVAGAYVVVVSITGAALVFRIDLQRASHPGLFTASRGVLADPVSIMESVSRAYPNHRLSGVDAPTTSRPTYLSYVTSRDGFKTVLVDPVTAQVLGELPDRSWVRALQDLHYDLLAGRTGRIINGAGALAIVALGVTGLIIWWPRGPGWRRAFLVDRTQRGRRLLWELHRATGIWSVVLILMWATTGAYFAFPAPFRAAIGVLSPLTPNRTPASTMRIDRQAPTWRDVIDVARQRHPDGHVARVVLPFGDRGSWLVMFSRRQPTPAYTELDSVYIDRYTGEVIEIGALEPSVGDRITQSMAALHVGNFGGTPIRLAWFGFGLAPALLAITGAIVWWGGRRR